MYEKLVENWLTNVNELGYQIPFCEALVADGYSILHVSSHGPGEHGKDVIARDPAGGLCTFQLKGHDLTLAGWRQIRDEVAELVQLPVRLPGVDENEPHVPHLVTNGAIRGDAAESIKRFAAKWVKDGSPELQVWSGGVVLHRFLSANQSFLPDSLADFRRFVELYAEDFNGPFPRAKFSRLIEPIVSTKTAGLKPQQKARVIAGIALTAAYIVEQFSRAENHVAAAEGWTITAASILHVAERDHLSERYYVPTLALVRLSLDRALDSCAKEVLSGDDLVVRSFGIADPHVYGARVALVLGWISVWALDAVWRRDLSVEIRDIIKLFQREFPARRLHGESDWPYLLAFALFLERAGYSNDAESTYSNWLGSILRLNRSGRLPGVPNPYWSQEKVLELINGMLPAFENESFKGHSYTALQAADLLVRRLRRQAVSAHWRALTLLTHCDFTPEVPEDYFKWYCEKGELINRRLPSSASWSEWRARVTSVETENVPQTLIRHSEWLLPFVCTYPHRLNSRILGLIDAKIGQRCELH